MDSELIIYLLIMSFLLLMSAFFSGTETAFFSLNLLEKHKLRRRFGAGLGNFVKDILENPEGILITILTGNMFVNLFFASLMDRVVERFIEQDSWLFSIAIGTVAVLIFGEMTPKNMAVRHSLPFFSFSARPIYVIHSLLSPIRRIIQILANRLVSFISGKISQEDVDTRILITSALQAGLKKGIIHSSELRILESFLDFREKPVREIMIPRTQIFGMDIEEGMERAVGDFISAGEQSATAPFGLIPVFRGDMDHITGYLDVQDLLPFNYGLLDEKGLAGLVKPVIPVPEMKNILEILREMMKINRTMAVVIDEYGGTAGLVTFQHLIENVLSFFYPSSPDGYKKLADGVYLIPGQFDLEELQELLKVEFESESRTLAGLLTERIGEIPTRNSRITLSGILFIVRRVSRKRILQVEVRRAE
jgi:CBS domain containing-hemolysin-like protein